jgi:hypothetical protein
MRSGIANCLQTWQTVLYLNEIVKFNGNAGIVGTFIKEKKPQKSALHVNMRKVITSYSWKITSTWYSALLASILAK